HRTARGALGSMGSSGSGVPWVRFRRFTGSQVPAVRVHAVQEVHPAMYGCGRADPRPFRWVCLWNPVLPVVCLRTVLAREVAVDEVVVWERLVGGEGAHAPFQTRKELQHLGVLDGLEGVAAPGERTVIRDEHARRSRGVERELLEALDDDEAGIALVGAVHFFARHRSCD